MPNIRLPQTLAQPLSSPDNCLRSRSEQAAELYNTATSVMQQAKTKNKCYDFGKHAWKTMPTYKCVNSYTQSWKRLRCIRSITHAQHTWKCYSTWPVRKCFIALWFKNSTKIAPNVHVCLPCTHTHTNFPVSRHVQTLAINAEQDNHAHANL